jgi:diacylglycerol kinase family enzyme
MRLDGADLETALYWMVIGNTRSYGGFRNITLRAVADDGQLDVALMQQGGLFHLGVDGVRVMLGRHDRSPNVRYIPAREIVVETEGLPVQVDGEAIGATPMQFDVAPRALTVIIPRGLHSPLFSAARPRVGTPGEAQEP